MLDTDPYKIDEPCRGIYLLTANDGLSTTLATYLSRQAGLPVLRTHPIELISLLEQDDHGVMMLIADSRATDGEGNQLLHSLVERRVPLISITPDDTAAPAPTCSNLLGVIDPADANSVSQAQCLVEQVLTNHRTRILVLHENEGQRTYLQDLLTSHYYRVEVACDAAEAVELLSVYPTTSVLLMSEAARHSCELDVIATLRERYSLDTLAILGLTRKRDPALLAAMLDAGANDVVPTSTDDAELLARVRGLARLVTTSRQLRERVYRDPLSGAYTEDYFSDVGKKIFANAQRGNLQFSVAVFNIDNFRGINELHGASVADGVLAGVARTIQQQLRETDFVARADGDEFICLASYVGRRNVRGVFERVAQAINSSGVWVGNQQIPVTVCVGATPETGASLDAMVSRARLASVRARQAGMSQIEIL